MAAKKHIVQLEQNNTLFKALLENSWDAIVLIDKKARVKYASPSTIRLFGREYDEFAKVSGIKYIHPLDAPVVAKGLAKILLKPEEPIHMEMRIRHKSGRYLWVEALATNFLSDKNIKGIIVNYHDITALKQIEERKDEFISIASHELMTPITSLKAYLQLFKKGEDTISPEKIDDYLQKMSSQIQRLERLVSDIYDTSRIREGKLSLKKEKFVLHTLIKETAEDIEHSYGSHKILIQSKFSGKIIADKMRIQQILVNLLSNAIKFSQNKNRIRMALWQKGNWAYVSITDYGSGISKENITKIAERFFQADTANKSSAGLGLGLYISFNIVKQHGGDISVKSTLGKSTTITFSLPKK